MEDPIKKWFERDDIRTFPGSAEYFEDEPDNLPLRYILQLDENNEKPFTKDLLSSEIEVVNQLLDEVSIAIRAYQQFQDILGIVAQKDMDIINRHYCYYESLVYLRESAVAWLDKNVLSSLTMLRPFLELSLLHIYWHLKCEFDSYKFYYEWLEGKRGKPPFKNLLDFIFKNIRLPDKIDAARIKFLKEVITNSYEFLCSYNHTPKIEESLTTLGMSSKGVTPLAFTVYSTHLLILLKQLVYLYILVYPYSLYPFNQNEYVGYDKTVAIFFDDVNFKIVQKFIGKNNIEKLKSVFDEDYRIIAHKKKIESLKPLSEVELTASWKRFISRPQFSMRDTESFKERHIHHKAYIRSISFAINYIVDRTSFGDISDEYFSEYEQKMNSW